ncbi:MAG: hypothetical protein SFU25_02975 [Candidatus Caenarcaniphilales bacterium]|nr:hypothetical protein [Candidatus Caenarcaniphilales bacterium]
MRSNFKLKNNYNNSNQLPLQARRDYLQVVQPLEEEYQELKAKQSFKIFSSSPRQRFLSKLAYLQKIVLNVALLGVLGAGLSYFSLISVEFEVSKQMNKLDKQMKAREDLKSYLGKAYSWANLINTAKLNKFEEAKNIEVSEAKDSLSYALFDFEE